jgi:ceramide glucosyltransferase
MSALQGLLLVPVVAGSLYSIACVLALARWRALARRPRREPGAWPAVTLLKPVCGLEKGLEENLRSACRQDYPEVQVIFSVQRADDPALPLLRAVQREFGGRGSLEVAVVIDSAQTAPNGKIRNLMGALPFARHDVLVISDSDVRLGPDYLKTIVAPLADPADPADAADPADQEVGCVCTLYRATGASNRWERLEQLTFNADFVPGLVFAQVTGAAQFLLGASTALRRSTLEEIGGLAALGDYLVEDFEMGRRIRAAGKRVAVVPCFVDTIVDLQTAAQWWGHQVYWDQNTRAANPGGLFGTLLIRAFPFALLFAAARLADPLGLGVLAAAIAVRLAAAGLFLGWGLGDAAGVRGLALLPLRDLAGMVSWVLAFTRPTVVWRGGKFALTRGGKMVPRPRPREEPAA